MVAIALQADIEYPERLTKKLPHIGSKSNKREQRRGDTDDPERQDQSQNQDGSHPNISEFCQRHPQAKLCHGIIATSSSPSSVASSSTSTLTSMTGTLHPRIDLSSHGARASDGRSNGFGNRTKEESPTEATPSAGSPTPEASDTPHSPALILSNPTDAPVGLTATAPKSRTSGGVIAGAVIGSLAFLLLLSSLFFFLYRHRRKSHRIAPSSEFVRVTRPITPHERNNSGSMDDDPSLPLYINIGRDTQLESGSDPVLEKVADSQNQQREVRADIERRHTIREQLKRFSWNAH